MKIVSNHFIIICSVILSSLYYVVPSAPPESLTGMFSSATSLLITWSLPPEQDQNGVILGYNISYFAVDNSDNVTYTSTTETMINIIDLIVYTEYSVSVAAYTRIGTGPFDSIVERTDSARKFMILSDTDNNNNY